jgi:hypothetical protein
MPVSFFKTGNPRVGIPDDAQLFSMVLPDEVLRRDFGVDIRYAHFENSFAYIRFYLRGDDVVVSEIQSELYRKIKDPALRSRYEHWSRILLLAFEDYIEKKYIAPRGGGRIVIAGEDYQQRRWKENKLDPGLGRIIYRDLPALLGYVPIADIDHAPEKAGHLEGDEAEVPVPIEKGWSRAASGTTEIDGPLRAGMRALLRTDEKNRFAHGADMLLAASRSLPAIEPAPAFESSRREVIAGFEAVPQRRRSLAELPGMSPDLIHAYAQTLNFLPPFLFETLLRPDMTLISRAIVGDETHGRDASSGSLVVRPVHQDTAERHPRVEARPLEGDANEKRSVGFKGGGARADVPFGYENYELAKPSDGTKLPVYRVVDRTTGLPPSTGSHSFWGGQSRADAEIEFMNHVALHRLMLAVDGGPAAAAIPYDIGEADVLPVWTTLGTVFLTPVEYAARYLNGEQAGLAIFRAVTRSSIRIVLAAESLSSWRQIDRFLEEVYAVWGEKLDHVAEKPDPSASAESEMAYLLRVYERNKDAAERIIRKIEEKTLRTLGAVHGAGGHLGGSAHDFYESDDGGFIFPEKPIGAPTGGAPEMRNMTVAGEFMDLDRSIFLPWFRRPDLGADWTAPHRALLPDMQRDDLIYWGSSMYWMRQLLRGRRLKPGHELRQYPLGNPQTSGLISVPLTYDLDGERALELVRWVGGPDGRFVEHQHARIYNESFSRGESFGASAGSTSR